MALSNFTYTLIGVGAGALAVSWFMRQPHPAPRSRARLDRGLERIFKGGDLPRPRWAKKKAYERGVRSARRKLARHRARVH